LSKQVAAGAVKAFVISGVPTAVLIGRDGRILWRGHPMEKSEGAELTQRIDEALKAD
jgi:hypothetical protein